MCLATPACSDDSSAVASGSSGTAAQGDTPAACVNRDPSPHVTFSETRAAYPLETFTADCDARGGTVQTHPHCGGLNSCRGMSYDQTTQTFTEHTCRGANTCTGYTCIICDDDGTES